MFRRQKLGWLLCMLIYSISATMTHAQILTTNLELKTISNVGYPWQTVTLENSYAEAVVVCTHRLASNTNNSAVTRVRNVTGSSFDIKIQQFEDNPAVTATDVYCVISDEGAFNSAGLKYEARTRFVSVTTGLSVSGGWNNVNTVDVSADVTQNYTAPAVVGQVMSANDTRASAFFAHDCDVRANSPFESGMADGMCIGKHIGQINATRAAETIGYFVIESGAGAINDIAWAAAIGADTVAGTGNNPPYNYNVTGDFDHGVLSQAGEDGGQGGWPVFYGADPFPNNQIRLAIEEETVAGDTSRTHTNERVAYWIFDNNQTATLSAAKNVSMSADAASPYAIPGSDVIYELVVSNAGSGPVDGDTLFLTDAIPPEVTVYNGDIDGAGPETAAVVLVDSGGGVTLGAGDVAYANSATAPTTFAACNYTPSAGYDSNITHICLAPKGIMREGTITPSSFAIRFRAKID